MDPLIYQQLSDETLIDVPEQPALDAQSRAYREMGPDDAVTDDEIQHYAVRSHPPLDANPDDPPLLLGPDYFERRGWDAGREDPR